MKSKPYFSRLVFLFAFTAHLAHSADSPISDSIPSQIQPDPIPPESKSDAPSTALVLDQSPEFIQALGDLGLLQMRQGSILRLGRKHKLV